MYIMHSYPKPHNITQQYYYNNNNNNVLLPILFNETFYIKVLHII